MLEALQYEFMRNALAAGILAGIACGIIGVYVIVKRIVFISGGISHAAFGGIGLGYLLFRLYRLGMKGSGWLKFKVFLYLIIAWNFLTFSGHWMNEFVAAEKFIKSNGKLVAFSVNNFRDAYFYLTRLDHLLLVPSLTFLLLALRKWRLP